MFKTNSGIAGVFILEPARFSDDRGWFSETWNQRKFEQEDIRTEFVQDNHSYSKNRGTVRGLHFQAPPSAQAKLVRVLTGRVLDVAVDIRKGSSTFGEWVSAELSAENGKQLLVPIGFLHGFITLEDDTEVAYKCSDFYAPECDGNVRFDDPDLAIDWGDAAKNAVLSGKDEVAPLFRDFDSPFVFDG